LRQKAFNVYEETMRVPLIFSNPVLFPDPATCPHPASLVDLVPTVAGLTGATQAAERERLAAKLAATEDRLARPVPG
jgi:arylsulfatase A-like enzyme